MTDNELNALVAEKVMGFVKLRYVYPSPYPNNDGILLGTVYGQEKPIPDYANDIAAAWRVIKHFQSRGFGWRIQLEQDCRTWRVCNHDDGLFLAGWEEKHGYISVTATTAPLAICLAALDAVGVTVEVGAGVGMTWDISENDHDELRDMFGV